MFIPVGLIVRLVAGAARDAAIESEMRAQAYAHDVAVWNARARELWDACTGDVASLVVLGNNDWTESWIDGVRVVTEATEAQKGGGYREAFDVLGPGPHGLLGVCPGRHTIATRLGDQWAKASFVLFPREALCLRLDRDTCVFDTYEKAHAEAILARLGTGALSLVNYSSEVALPLVHGYRAKASREAIGQCLLHVKAMVTASTGRDEARTFGCAHEAVAALHGAPVSSFEPITSAIGFQSFDLIAKGKVDSARMLLRAGLVVLPEDPTLLAVLGELCLSAGELPEGRGLLERALARETGLDERMNARARELLAR